MASRARTERNYRGLSHIDYVHKKMWVVQAVCFGIAVLVFFGTLVAASINLTEGFPCFFAAVVDYRTVNTTLVHTGLTYPRLGGVVPVLFFQTKAVVFFFYATSIVFVFLVCYITVGAIISSKKHVGAAYMGSGAFVFSLMASPLTILLGTVSIWLLQAVVIVLAHKLIVLAAAVYLVHFSTITFFYGYFCGRGVDSKVYAEDISSAKDIDGSLHKLIGNVRAMMVNLLSIVYSIILIMSSLMFGMLLANSFTLKFWHVIVTVLITTSVLTLIYLLVIEFLIARYVHIILGAYIGLLIGYGMLWTTTCDYVNRFYYAMGANASNLRIACHSVLAVFTVLILLAMVVRLIRASLYHRRRSTRAYAKAMKLQQNVKHRLRQLRRSYKQRGSQSEDERALTQSRSAEASDEDTIYDRVYSGSESEWDD